VLNHTTEDDDVAFAIDRVAEAEIDELEDGGAPRTRPQVAGTTVRAATPARAGFTIADLRRVRGFEAVTDDQAGRFLAVAREERYAPTDVVTERWAHART